MTVFLAAWKVPRGPHIDSGGHETDDDPGVMVHAVLATYTPREGTVFEHSTVCGRKVTGGLDDDDRFLDYHDPQERCAQCEHAAGHSDAGLIVEIPRMDAGRGR